MKQEKFQGLFISQSLNQDFLQKIPNYNSLLTFILFKN